MKSEPLFKTVNLYFRIMLFFFFCVSQSKHLNEGVLGLRILRGEKVVR